MVETDLPVSVTPSATEIYPWHDGLWASLTRDLARLPHALLLHGQAGLGKQGFARRLALNLLCLEPDSAHAACGRCKNCQLFAAGNHPDFQLITPLEDSRTIIVDQIRALAEFVAFRPHTAARKVVVIAPAEAMNLNAANSLLKVLEEPPAGSFLILVTSQRARLPATIRSRCTHILFSAPERAQALAWLKSSGGNQQGIELLLEQARGAPLLAAEYARTGWLAQREQFLRDVTALRAGRETPLACAARWKGQGAAALAWLYGFVADLIRITLADDQTGLTNPDQFSQLQILEKSINLNELYVFLDAVSEAKNLLTGPLDELLLLEDILIRWHHLRVPIG
jgi:DNA polymerase-3 subunit delta'